MRNYLSISIIVVICIGAFSCKDRPRNNKSLSPKVSKDAVRLDTSVVPPVIISKPNIVFPSNINNIDSAITVYIQAEIDTSGNVRNVNIIKSQDHRFDSIAVELAYDYKFQPGKLHGKNIKTTTMWPIVFDKEK